MNLIEDRVEWHGNGVVVIRERSIAQMIWRVFIHVERKLYSTVHGITNVCKSQLSWLTLNMKKHTFSMMPSVRITSLPKITQTKPLQAKKHTMAESVRPAGTLTEIRRYAENNPAIMTGNDGQSALQQLLPALAGFCSDRWLVLVSPPQRPDIASLTAAGIDPARVLLVHARETQTYSVSGSTAMSNNNELNIVEQALQSGTCGAVVAWLEDCDTPALQRLRRAAVNGQAWGIMLRGDEKEMT